MKKRFRIVYTIKGAESTSEKAIRRCLDRQLDDLDEYAAGEITNRNVTAKIQERVKISYSDEARAERQRWTLAQSVEAQEERIAAHYTAFAHLAMQLRELTEARKHGCTTDLNDTIRYLTGKIREGHLMEFGIQLEWPNDGGER